MRVLIASTFLLVALLSGTVRAQPLPLRLEWSAPPVCGSRASLLGEVERIVGTVDDPNRPPVSARATVQRLPDGRYQVVLVTEVEGTQGERRLVGRDCAEVRRGTALILALMINPEAPLSPASEPATAPATAPRETPATPEPPPRPRPAASPEAAPAAPSTTAPSWLVGAGAIGGLGALPKASVGGELRFGWFGEWLAVELQWAGWLRRSKEAPGHAGAGGEFDLFGANLLAGVRRPLWVGGHGRLALGLAGRRMHASGFGVTDPGSATGYWAGALGELSLCQHLSGSVALRLRSGLELASRPPRFAIRGVGVVHRPHPVAGFVGLGLELQF